MPPKALLQIKDKLIVSCQAAPGDPLDDTDTIRRIAGAAVGAGAAGLRLNSSEHIAAIRRDTDLPIIGIKKQYYDGQLRITPDFAAAAELAAAGADIIALDCTTVRGLPASPGSASSKGSITSSICLSWLISQR
jgi:putative N-acetylmannosamine-6-phosphate epimerase